ncbi:hypothetical protein CAPTEDRAFT_19176 [Capitella teleta]|uniref:Kynureninase n=1 Tax=Capitella teleta TaxID=283909 RepID=R7UV18_CAPTE|nr:hypothetical protein CAPTEDRAFT_19176 [Capitella teleta]|eukprot:ELU10483.1 hypothetical protein CAPTEDRAFT_19176 [Capitella teleta]
MAACSVVETLEQKAKQWACEVHSEEFATQMDNADPLKELRGEFSIPKVQDLPYIDESMVSDRKQDDCVYMCGNSLGLKPKAIHETLNRELEKWSKIGVYGHTMGEMPWAWCEDVVKEDVARIVGADPEEVSIMNGLTINLHLLLISFYRPTPTRHKVLIEAHSFPSDHYAVESQIRLHGYDPETSMICLEPREGEETLRTEDIVKVIEDEGDSIAVIAWTGVQYYTGQLFDMETIVQKGHSKGCYVGFDLAHAAGNVPLRLHDWGVDYACWCTYKYLNSGAGCIAGAFIHEKHADNDFPKLSGWWGHKLTSRFQMDNKMDRSRGVAGYRVSNAPPMLCACLEASVQVFAKTSMEDLRHKSVQLTGYLEHLLKTAYPKNDSGKPFIEIITPADPAQRGAQLSIKFSVPIGKVFEELKKRAVVLDKREPNVLRVAPAPIYNSFTDVFRFVKLLGESMHAASVTSF